MSKSRVTGIAVAVAIALAIWFVGSLDDDDSDDSDERRGGARSDGERAVVVNVHDGDTIRVRVGDVEERIRIIGYDAPEVGSNAECGGEEATAVVDDLVSVGDEVVLVADPTQDDQDRYERLLRYVETTDGRRCRSRRRRGRMGRGADLRRRVRTPRLL